jgi:GT2 family glycosyltransferase
MPTKIIQVELKEPSLPIEGHEGYGEALIFLRYIGRPVGQLRVPVVEGRISIAEVEQHIRGLDQSPLWNRVAQEFLDWEAEEHPPFRPTASVVVITRERPEDLRRCLEALVALPDDGQEIIVVDNRPVTDATLQVVRGFGSRVRYVREDIPGSSAARNRGLREARHDIVAFTDDDAVPEPGWLRALGRNFRDPRVLAVTGLVVPLELETKAQEEFEKYTPHGRGFTRQVFSLETHYALHVAPAGVSANMALRKDITQLVGGFDEALGVGTPSHCGEDYDLFTRILRAGYQIVYDPAAVNWHRHRRTWPELRRVIHAYGVGVYAAWTRLLLFEREPSVPLMALRWFVHRQFPDFIAALLGRPGYAPLDLQLAQLRGCLVGPFAYFRSRRQRRVMGSAA